MTGLQINTLDDYFDQITVLTEGYEFEYEGYTLRKTETPGLSPAHSEVEVLNRDGCKVESLTLSAYDSVDFLETFLVRLLDYDPDSVTDWLQK